MPAADSVDELEADDDEPESLEPEEESDEVDELESAGLANATPGVLATAAPTPSATANEPTRTMYCTFTGMGLSPLIANCCETLMHRRPVSFFLRGDLTWRFADNFAMIRRSPTIDQLSTYQRPRRTASNRRANCLAASATMVRNFSMAKGLHRDIKVAAEMYLGC